MNKKNITVDFIDKQKFETLVHLGLTDMELYEFFMCSCGAMMTWIKITYNVKSPYVALKKMRVEGKIDFMMKQRKLAEKNPAVSIWLGKNLYEQTDGKEEQEKEQDFEDLSPLADLLKDEPKDEQDTNN